jgi:hypothetical protein
VHNEEDAMATSASSATTASGVSSSSSPEVRTVERLKKKERRKSLRERLVASWSLHAADGAATDPAKPRHSAGLHKVQSGRVVGLARDYEEACGSSGGVTGNSSTNDDRHNNNNNDGTPRRRFDGSSSTGSPRPGLRYKNGIALPSPSSFFVAFRSFTFPVRELCSEHHHVVLNTFISSHFLLRVLIIHWFV